MISRILNRDALLTVYDRLTGLIDKLPGGLQKPILRELGPIRDVFLDQRAPRIMLVGSAGQSALEVLTMLGASQLQTGGSDNGWRLYKHGDRAAIEILDAREDVPAAHGPTGISRQEPDLVIFMDNGRMADETRNEAMGRAALSEAPLIGLAAEGVSAFRLQAWLGNDPRLGKRVQRVLALQDAATVEIICATLPLAAQLEFARLTNARQAQAQIARSLLKSFSAVCGVIAVQPIPLADMPILTTLQTLMVGLIIRTTGRPFSVRLVVEFIGALGFNIGLGLALREGARAMARVVPIWGNAVSGFVAGAGTYAIGRAAIAYFIEDTPIQETRRIFRSLLPRFGKPSRKPPALPLD